MKTERSGKGSGTPPVLARATARVLTPFLRGGRSVAALLAPMLTLGRSTWLAVAAALPAGLVVGLLVAAMLTVPLAGAGSAGPARSLVLAILLALGRTGVVATPALLVFAVAVRAGSSAVADRAPSSARRQLAAACKRLPALLCTAAAAILAVGALVFFAVPTTVVLALGALVALVRRDWTRARRRAVRALPFAAAGAAAVALALALPAAAAGASPREALGQSRRRTRGRRWRTTGLLLAVAAVGAVPDLLLAAPVLTGAVGPSSPGPLQFLAALLAWIGSCLLLVVVGTAGAGLLARTTEPRASGLVSQHRSGPAPVRPPARRLRPLLQRSSRLVAGAVVVALLAAALPAHAEASDAGPTILTVNTHRDPAEWAGDDCVDHQSGTPANCSLRQALARAELTQGPDEVVLGPDLGEGEVGLDVDRPLPLVGGVVLDGGGRAVLQPGMSSRGGPLFEPTNGIGTTELHGVTLQGGSGDEGAGGALTVSSQQTVRLLEAVLRDYDGGAVVSDGRLVVERSTLLHGTGTAISSSGSLSVINSTVVTAADEQGSAFLTMGGSGSLNAVTLLGGGSVDAPEGSLEIRNSLLSSPRGCTGSVTGGANLSNGEGCAAGGPVVGLADAPADNGGPTPTVLLAPGSPAVGAGDSATCPAVDQRGVARPADACDLGAVQVGDSGATDSPSLLLEAAASDTVLDDPVALTVTLRGAAGPARITVVDTSTEPEVEVASADLGEGVTTIELSATGLALGTHHLVARTTVGGTSVASPPIDHRVRRPGGALTLLVDDSGDDPSVGPNTCTPTTSCTLRGALIAAAAEPTPRNITIGVAPALDLTVPTKAPLPLVDGVTIDGDGRLVVDAEDDHPVTRAVGAPVATTLRGLTLRGGNATDGRSLVGVAGGALHVRAGDVVTVRESVLRDNASPYGGAVFNGGTLVVDRSTLLNDRGVDPTGLDGYDGTWPIRFGRTSGVAGILSRGSLTVTNSTLRNEYGGPSAPAVLQESLPVATLDQVTSNLSGALVGTTPDETPALRLRNSLLLSPVGSGRCAGLTADSGPNGVTELFDTRVDPEAVAAACAAGAEPITGLDEGFGDHGGHTPTYALTDDSNARGAGDDATCLHVDQRGVPRPLGACDLGAYQYATSLNVTVSPTSTLGDDVPVTVDLPGLATGGRLHVLDGDTPIATTETVDSASQTLVLTGLVAGEHALRAAYLVNGQELTSPTVVHRVQAPTATTVATAGPVVYGTDARVTVTVAGPPGAPVPTGEVRATTTLPPGEGNPTRELRAELVDGAATLDLPTGPDNYDVTVRYVGDDRSAPSEGSVRQVVTPAPSTTTVPGPITLDRLAPLPVEASVASSRPVHGKLEVSEGTTVLGTLDVAAGSVHADLSVDLAAGHHELVLAFLGSAGFAPSSTTLPVTVRRLASTVSVHMPATSTYAEPPLARVVVSPAGGAERGTATLLDGTDPVATVELGRTDDGLVGTVRLPRLALGAHSLTASFAGDADLAPGASEAAPLTVTAQPVELRLDLPVSSGNRGQDIVVRAVTTPAARGAVVLHDALGASVRGDLVDGAIHLTLPATSLGRHDLTGEFRPDGEEFSPSTATATYTVVLRSTNLVFDPGPREVPFGGYALDVELPSTDGVVPTGTVHLEGGGARSPSVQLVDGRAHVPFSALAPYPRPGEPGFYAPFPYDAVAVVYSGDGDYAPITVGEAYADVRIVALPTRTVLTGATVLEPVPGASSSTAYEGGLVRFAAMVERADGQPVSYGQVVFRAGAAPGMVHAACVQPDGTATVDGAVHGQGLHVYGAVWDPTGCSGPTHGGLLPSTAEEEAYVDVRYRPQTPGLSIEVLTEVNEGGQERLRPPSLPTAVGDRLLVRVREQGPPQSGEPAVLPGLALTVDGAPIARRADGLFVLPVLHAGVHEMRAAFPGDATRSASDADQAMELVPMPVSVSGTLLDPEGDAATTLGARVRIAVSPEAGRGLGTLPAAPDATTGYGVLTVLVDGQVQEQLPVRELPGGGAGVVLDRPAPSPLTAGAHPVEVRFSGSRDVAPGASTQSVDVRRSPPHLTVNVPGSAQPRAGRPLTVEVGVRRDSGLPAARVQVHAGQSSCEVSVSGVGRCTLDGADLLPGQDVVTAHFDGNDFLEPEVASTTVEVLPAAPQVDVRRRAGAYVLAGRRQPLADVTVTDVPEGRTQVLLVEDGHERVLCDAVELESSCTAAVPRTMTLVRSARLHVRFTSTYAPPVEVDAGALSVAQCVPLRLSRDATADHAGDCPGGAPDEYLPSEISGQDVELTASPRHDYRVRSWSLPGDRTETVGGAGRLRLSVDDRLLDRAGDQLVKPVYERWVDCVPLLITVESKGGRGAGAAIDPGEDPECAQQQLEEPEDVHAPPRTLVSWHARDVPAQVTVERRVFGSAARYTPGQDESLALLFGATWQDQPLDVHDYDPAEQVRVYDMSGPQHATVTVTPPCVRPELFVGDSRGDGAEAHGELVAHRYADPVDGVIVDGTVLERAGQDAATWGNPDACLPGTSLQYEARAHGPGNGVHSLRVGVASDPRLHTGTTGGNATDLRVQPWVAVGADDPQSRQVTALADPTLGVEAVFSRVYCHQVTLAGSGPAGMPGLGTAEGLVLEPSTTCPAGGPDWVLDGASVRAVAAAKSAFDTGVGRFDQNHLDGLTRRAGAGDADAAAELARLERIADHRSEGHVQFEGFREHGDNRLLGRTLPSSYTDANAEFDVATPVFESYAERETDPLAASRGSLQLLHVTRPLDLDAVYALASGNGGLGCGSLTVRSHPAGVPVQQRSSSDPSVCGVNERVATGDDVTLRAESGSLAGLVPVWELRDATGAGIRTASVLSQPGDLGYDAHYQVEFDAEHQPQQPSEVRFVMPPYSASADLWLCQKVRPRVLLTDDSGHEQSLGDEESMALLTVRTSAPGGQCPVAGHFLPGSPVTLGLRSTEVLGHTTPSWEVDGVRTTGASVTFPATATGEREIVVRLQVDCRTLTMPTEGPVTMTPAPNCPGARSAGPYQTRWLAGTVVALTAGEKVHNDFYTWHGDVVRQSGATAVTILDRDRHVEPDWNRRSDGQIILDGLATFAQKTVGVLALVAKGIAEAEAEILTLTGYAIHGVTSLLQMLGVSGQGLDALVAMGATLDIMSTGLTSAFDCLYETSYTSQNDVSGTVAAGGVARDPMASLGAAPYSDIYGTPVEMTVDALKPAFTKLIGAQNVPKLEKAGAVIAVGGAIAAIAVDPPVWENTASQAWDGYGSRLGACIADKNTAAWDTAAQAYARSRAH